MYAKESDRYIFFFLISTLYTWSFHHFLYYLENITYIKNVVIMSNLQHNLGCRAFDFWYFIFLFIIGIAVAWIMKVSLKCGWFSLCSFRLLSLSNFKNKIDQITSQIFLKLTLLFAVVRPCKYRSWIMCRLLIDAGWHCTWMQFCSVFSQLFSFNY